MFSCTISQSQYYVHASSIADVTKIQIQAASDGLDDLATEVTSYAEISNSTFPFVTMPNFEVNAHNARRQSSVEVIFLNHMVTAATKQAYEMYTLKHQGWIQESRTKRLRGQGNLDATVFMDTPIIPFIFEMDFEMNFLPSAPDKEV